jgi:hypothetical protein
MKKLLIVVFLFLAGCGSTALIPKTFDERVIYTNTALTAVNLSATTALQNKLIAKPVAVSVYEKTVEAGKLIDEAVASHTVAPAVSESKIDQAISLIEVARGILSSLGVKI